MSKAQIMIVEDEGIVGLEIKEGLEKLGYKVPEVIPTGAEAINKIMFLQPDLVLMDIRLSGPIDGIEAAKQIRKNFFIPVIFLTAHSDDRTLERAKTAGSYGYILKPFEDRALNAAIEIALFKANEEKQLKGYNKWLSIILGNIGEGVIVSGIKGDIKYVNEIVENLLDCNPNKLLAKRLHEVFTIVDKRTHKLKSIELTKPIMEGSIIKKQSILLLKNNKEMEIEYTIAPLKNSNNTIIGVIIVFKELNEKIKENTLEQRELEQPKIIQKKLLPKNGQSIQGIKINWLFYPSRFGSGDIFNFFKLDEHNIGFYLLDVMGHGFSAAVFSTTLYRFLSPNLQKDSILKRNRNNKENHPKRRKSDLLPKIINPARVITELNKRFYFEDNTNPFFTIVYGIINTKKNTCTIARAGHLPPIVQNLNGDISIIKTKGFAIGIFPEMEITEEEVEFKKGDRLFIYSDGLIESTNRYTDQFSEERLHMAIKGNRKNNLQKLIENLKGSILDWRENRQMDDDIAFMAIERE